MPLKATDALLRPDALWPHLSPTLVVGKWLVSDCSPSACRRPPRPSTASGPSPPSTPPSSACSTVADSTKPSTVWALTRLPGTVSTAHPEVLACDLIHEVAHDRLNDALATYDVSLSADVTFFSPWRGTPRPDYGLLHACWAFSLTVLYARQAGCDATGAVVPLLDAHLRQQESQFASALDSLAEALSYVSADVLRDRISHAVSKAVESA